MSSSKSRILGAGSVVVAIVLLYLGAWVYALAYYLITHRVWDWVTEDLQRFRGQPFVEISWTVGQSAVDFAAGCICDPRSLPEIVAGQGRAGAWPAALPVIGNPQNGSRRDRAGRVASGWNYLRPLRVGAGRNASGLALIGDGH
jgi:hypothetical protein